MADDRRAGLAHWLSSSFEGLRSKPRPTKTQGVSGIVSAGGYVMPMESDPRLVGDTKWKTYAEILHDTAMVSAGVRYFLNLVAKAEWKAEAVDDSSEAVEAAEFVDEVLDRMETSWHRIVRRAALYRFYGFSIQEWTAAKWEDGRIGMKDVELRPQRTISRWDLDLSGTVNGVAQLAPQTGVELYLPRTKILYLVDDALSDDPQGTGIMRHLFEAAMRYRRYRQLEGWGYETDLRGIPVGRAPLSTLRKQLADGVINQSQFDKALADIRSFLGDHVKNPNTGFLVDSEPYRNFDPAGNPASVPMWAFELLTGGSSGFEWVTKALDQLNHEMAWILGTEHMLLGGDQGSHALAKNKSNNLYLVVDSVLTEIAQAADRDIIDSIWSLNGLDEELKPHMTTESSQFKDIEQVTAALRDMATAGAPLGPDDPAINAVRGLLALPDATTPGPGMMMDASLMGAGVAPEDLGLPASGNPFEAQGEGGLALGGDTVDPAIAPEARLPARDESRGKTKKFMALDSSEARALRRVRKLRKRK